jgi:hypothetical protein
MQYRKGKPMTVQEKHCPRCGIKRTVWLGEWGSFCFNCRLRWGRGSGIAPQPAPTATVSPQRFEGLLPAELARLATYRAAVRAGFYTDWPTPDTSATVLDRVPGAL